MDGSGLSTSGLLRKELKLMTNCRDNPPGKSLHKGIAIKQTISGSVSSKGLQGGAEVWDQIV